MDKLGYLLSELPALFFIVWFAVRFFQFRRRKKNQPSYSEGDRELLFGAAKKHEAKRAVYLRLALAIIAVSTIGALEIFVLAPLGAAIITGSVLLTSTLIVHRLL
jgi:cbb3-type cytochrome oxidase subunit 3